MKSCRSKITNIKRNSIGKNTIGLEVLLSLFTSYKNQLLAVELFKSPNSSFDQSLILILSHLAVSTIAFSFTAFGFTCPFQDIIRYPANHPATRQASRRNGCRYPHSNLASPGSSPHDHSKDKKDKKKRSIQRNTKQTHQRKEEEMARFAHFGNARTPTWLRPQHRSPNIITTTKNTKATTTTTTKSTTKPNTDPDRPERRGGRGPLFVRSPAPSPSPASPGTLRAESPGHPVVVVVVVGGGGERRGLACHRVGKHDLEFRLVQRRAGLVAMRRSRKARHRREREYLAGIFGAAEGEGRDVSGGEGGGGDGVLGAGGGGAQ